MKRKRQKKEAVFTVFFIILLMVQTGCAAKAEAALPDGLFVQEDRIVTVDAGSDAAETEETGQPQEEAKTAADVSVITPSGEASGSAAVRESDEPAYVYVHICGEVSHPGVYRMPQGSRIYQAVEQAGGLLTTAEETAVNQALLLEDGMKVWIPPREEVGEAEESGTSDAAGSSRKAALQDGQSTGGGNRAARSEQAYITVGADATGSTQATDSIGTAGTRVNINTATEDELCTLTGIGKSRAKSIIQYRNEHGNFKRKEDIMKVTGIKDGAFAKIKDEIAVE